MGKIGIIIDSSSGLTKKEAESKGFYFAPIIIDYNGVEKKVGVDIDNEFLFKHMNKNSKFKTAAVPMGVIDELIKKAIFENDRVIVLTISKYISSGNDNAKIVAKNYKNVYVHDSTFITPWIEHILDTLIQLANENKYDEIIDLIKLQEQANYALLAPSSLEFLFAGGRISRTQYLTGNLLKILPIITLREGSLQKDDVIKARTEKKAAKKIAGLIKKVYDEAIKNNFDVECAIISSNADDFEKLVVEAMEKHDLTNLVQTNITAEIVTHIGPKFVGA
ncbi:MAG: DegV family EDD domain-containing protein, partial [Mycoplasmataceae bacterium]|nr:DegV family EDD domain-containing protein [Mycoplasmataceae bacterium]